MSYIKKEHMRTLGKVWNELSRNDGRLSYETFTEYSRLLKQFVSDNERHTEKTRRYVAEKRKVDKSYGRGKGYIRKNVQG